MITGLGVTTGGLAVLSSATSGEMRCFSVLESSMSASDSLVSLIMLSGTLCFLSITDCAAQMSSSEARLLLRGRDTG